MLSAVADVRTCKHNMLLAHKSSSSHTMPLEKSDSWARVGTIADILEGFLTNTIWLSSVFDLVTGLARVFPELCQKQEASGLGAISSYGKIRTRKNILEKNNQYTTLLPGPTV